MDKKKKIIIISSIILLLTVIGVTYAWFQFYQEGENNKLIAGDIYLTYNEGNDVINLVNVLPETPTEARARNDNFMTFSLSGVNTTSNTLYYEILLNYGDELSGYQRFNDSDLKFDLVSLDSNGNEVSYLISNQSVTNLNNYRIYVDTVAANTSSEVVKRYKLRVWLSGDVLISDTDPRASYPATGTNAFNTHFASVKVAVYGDFVAKQNPDSLYSKIQNLASESYIGTYSGEHNDTLAGSGTNTIYYYTGANAAANSNVLFAGFCWQIVRTTDDGGVKLLFNGVPDANNECGANRDPIVGIKGTSGTQSTDLSSEYIYGKSFTYSEVTHQFELQDVMTKTWGDSTYSDLIGTYTCKNVNPCTTLYYVGHYQDGTHASTASFTIGSVTNYQTIGTSAFNAYYDSPALVGYMYNAVYTYKTGLKTGNHLYGNNVTYANGNYTVGATQASLDNTHHYTCDSDVENQVTCAKVRYYYRSNTSDNVTTYYYIVLENGKKINDALKDMINYKENNSDTDANINKYNSAIKGTLENWYRHSLAGYTSYLDQDIVYCNERRTRGIGGWTVNESLANYITFQQNTPTTDLSCVNRVDSFSTKNGSAKLDYAIGLLTEPERGLMGDDYSAVNNAWWLASPSNFNANRANVRGVNADGSAYSSTANAGYAVRPAITLKPGTTVLRGSGSTIAPYVIN